MYKEMLAEFIVKIEGRLNQVFDIIQSDPTIFKYDKEFLLLSNRLCDKLEEYNREV